MRVPRSVTLSMLAGAVAAPSVLLAQRQGPVAVPIVGSPAASQPSQPSTPPMPAPDPQPAPPIPANVPASTSPPAAEPQAAPKPRKLDISFNKGTVTLSAQNVTVREILAEWQRRDGCRFVNGDRVPGGPITVEFPQKPELEVLESLLRGVAGYLVAPRSDTAESGSVCGAVYILPTSTPTVTTSGYAPNVQTPMPAPLIQAGSPDDEIPPVMMPPRAPAMPGQPPNQGQGPVPGQNQPPNSAPTGFGPVPVTTTGPGRIGGPAPSTQSPVPSPMPAPGAGGPGRGGGPQN